MKKRKDNHFSTGEKSRYFGNYEKSACGKTSPKDQCHCHCSSCNGKIPCSCGCNCCNCSGIPKGHCCD